MGNTQKQQCLRIWCVSSCVTTPLSSTRRCGSNKVLFNSEPNNLTNLNRLKDSGLANAKAISLVADEKGVTMALKSSKRQRQIKKNAQGTQMKGSFRKVAKAITKST